MILDLLALTPLALLTDWCYDAIRSLDRADSDRAYAGALYWWTEP